MQKNNISNNLSLIFLFLVLLAALSPQLSAAFEKTYLNSIGMEFVLIPAGTFVMGSPEDEKNNDRFGGEVQHEVTLTKTFYMQTTEVTIEQWQRVMGKKLIGRRRGPKDLPVTKVSWKDCQKFIKKLNAIGEGVYRLPTEAEWEYACRAGSKTAYAWGDEIDCSQAMYGNKKKSGTCTHYVKTLKLPAGQPAPVKTYAPNRWGLYDMHGNVWEWCQDWYGAYEMDRKKDPIGQKKGSKRIRRGGSWYSQDYDCRSANRAFAIPSNRIKITGFRVVREAL